MPQINIPTITFTGKRKKRSQLTKIYTPAGAARRREMDVARQCVDDIPTRQGFLLDARQIYRDRKTGQSVLVLWEGSAYPPPLRVKTDKDEADFDDMVDKLYVEHKAIAKEEQAENASANMNPILWAVGMVVAGFVTIAALAFFR